MKAEPQRIEIVILAGGTSRRMKGRDKALIRVDGVPLIKQVVKAATNAGWPVTVVGRQTRDLLVELDDTHIRIIPDITPDQGPLGGLYTAMLDQPAGDLILLCACDLPFVSTNCFTWLTSESKQTDFAHFDGIVPTWQGRPEPLFAIYSMKLLPTIAELLKADRSMQSLLRNGQFKSVLLPANMTGAIHDVDTPEELEEVLRQKREFIKHL